MDLLLDVVLGGDGAFAAEGAPAEFKALCEKIKAVDQFDEKGQGVEEMRKLVAELAALPVL